MGIWVMVPILMITCSVLLCLHCRIMLNWLKWSHSIGEELSIQCRTVVAKSSLPMIPHWCFWSDSIHRDTQTSSGQFCWSPKRKGCNSCGVLKQAPPNWPATFIQISVGRYLTVIGGVYSTVLPIESSRRYNLCMIEALRSTFEDAERILSHEYHLLKWHYIWWCNTSKDHDLFKTQHGRLQYCNPSSISIEGACSAL